VLTDAVPLPEVALPQRAVVRGDRCCLSIAAASIVAKVIRDAEMQRRAADYPAYGFAENKGYGTRRHVAALFSHGVTAEHRRSFAPVKYLLGLRDHVTAALPASGLSR
jgi:ribonuclease HII